MAGTLAVLTADEQAAARQRERPRSVHLGEHAESPPDAHAGPMVGCTFGSTAGPSIAVLVPSRMETRTVSRRTTRPKHVPDAGTGEREVSWHVVPRAERIARGTHDSSGSSGGATVSPLPGWNTDVLSLTPHLTQRTWSCARLGSWNQVLGLEWNPLDALGRTPERIERRTITALGIERRRQMLGTSAPGEARGSGLLPAAAGGCGHPCRGDRVRHHADEEAPFDDGQREEGGVRADDSLLGRAQKESREVARRLAATGTCGRRPAATPR